MKISYKTKGTCSQRIDLDIENGIVRNITYTGGCNCNTNGVALLAEGMSADDIIARCSGVTCGLKPTSCPDQLAKAVKYALEEENTAMQVA